MPTKAPPTDSKKPSVKTLKSKRLHVDPSSLGAIKAGSTCAVNDTHHRH